MKNLSIIFILFCQLAAVGQSDGTTENLQASPDPINYSKTHRANGSYYNHRKSGFGRNVFHALGIGVGQEYFFGVKGSLVKPFPFGRTLKKPKFGFYPKCFYVSIGASAFGLFAVWGGVGLNAGVSLGIFTLDNSVVAWGIVGPDSQTFGSTTYNPKIGLHLGPIWFKAGPSFRLSKELTDPNLLRPGRYNLNFELSYIIAD